MSDTILIVCEGERTEPMILDSMKNLLLLPQKILFIGVHGGEIYSLYHKIKSDENLDIARLLIQDKRNANRLEGLNPEKVSETYLFFDYDGHAPAADDKKIEHMLELFKEETDKGKLFISYPMVEAVKHICKNTDFKEVNAAINSNYKNCVSQQCDKEYLDITRYTKHHWNVIIEKNIKKMRWIYEEIFELPNVHINQDVLFSKQRQKFIPHNQVAVLSAFPAFIMSYYGVDKTIEMVQK